MEKSLRNLATETFKTVDNPNPSFMIWKTYLNKKKMREFVLTTVAKSHTSAANYGVMGIKVWWH